MGSPDWPSGKNRAICGGEAAGMLLGSIDCMGEKDGAVWVGCGGAADPHATEGRNLGGSG